MAVPVCGVNGETFASPCHAHMMHIHVDYSGKCSASPSLGTVVHSPLHYV